MRTFKAKYLAKGGRVPFQNAGLASLPYPDYYKLPPFSAGNTYTNAWTFPTDEEEEISTSNVIPASYKGYPSYDAWLAAQRGEGGGGDAPDYGNLQPTWTTLPGDPKNYRLSQLEGTSDYFPPTTGMGKAKNWFQDKFFQPKVRGTLGDRLYSQYQTGQTLPSWIAAIAGAQSGFNTKSKNYNPFWKEQLNYLERLGDKNTMYIGRDGGSGHLRYGPDSVLSGQNVISGFGSNNYATQLAKKLAWFEARDKEKRNEKKYQQTKDEITAWDNSPDNPKNKNNWKPTYNPASSHAEAQATGGDYHSGHESTVGGQTTDWGPNSAMIARGGLAQHAPRYANGGLASLWRR